MSNDNCKIIAEIGINHNGSIQICKQLIDIASTAMCDYVKIQKRNPDLCIPEHQKHTQKITPWGTMSYLEYKKKIEFNEQQIDELTEYAHKKQINFFASVWDKDSADLMKKYTNTTKIPSALITDIELCQYARQNFNKLIVSTGMSNETEIDNCIRSCNPDVIMHTNSVYPCPVDQLNLNYITWLKNKWPSKQIGYSGHEYGLVTTFAAATLGATWIERHITLDHSLWGSDQSSSLEPAALFKLVKGIRDIYKSKSICPSPRVITETEKIKKNSLRK